MKVKTSELTGAALNWVMATIKWPNDYGVLYPKFVDKEHVNVAYPFDKDWSLTGPILKKIDYLAKEGNSWVAGKGLLPGIGCFRYLSGTDSVFTSILRCYAASQLGWEVEVPDHLL